MIHVYNYIHILYIYNYILYTTHVWYYWGSIGMLPFFDCDPPFSQVPSFHRLDAAGVRLGGLRCAGRAQRHGDAVPLGGAHGATGHPRSVHLVSVWPQGPMTRVTRGAADEMNIRIKWEVQTWFLWELDEAGYCFLWCVPFIGCLHVFTVYYLNLFDLRIWLGDLMMFAVKAWVFEGTDPETWNSTRVGGHLTNVQHPFWLMVIEGCTN